MRRLALCLLLIILISTSTGLCPRGAVSTSYGCYLFTIFPLNFTQAEGVCQYAGGHLASVHSKQQNTLLTQLADINLDCGEVNAGCSIYNHDIWRNADGTNFDYNNMGFADPDMLAGPNPLYAVIQMLQYSYGNWTPKSMLSDRTPFICKVPECGSGAIPQKMCPDGSEYSEIFDKCVLGVQNKWLLLKQRTFVQAEQACQMYGGHLPSITNIYENNELLQKAIDFKLNNFYIGYHSVSNNKWSWTDGRDSSFFNFPNKKGPSTPAIYGNLTIMLSSLQNKTTDGQWRQADDNICNDQSCVGRDWICMLPKYTPSLC